jgi:membrane protease YdiL (CAAX protease family)
VAIGALTVALAFFILLGVYTNFPDQQGVSGIYLFMLIFVAVVAAQDAAREKIWFVGMVAYGKTRKNFVKALAIGAVFSVFLVGRNYVVGIPLSVFGDLNFWFIVVAAPVVEEYFFRFALFPTLRQQLISSGIKHASIIALAVSSIGFGFFHYYVFSGMLSAIYVAIVIGVIYTIGNYAVKSGGFSLGAHFVNNYLIFMR